MAATRRADREAFVTPREPGPTVDTHPAIRLLIDITAVIAVLRPLGQFL